MTFRKILPLALGLLMLVASPVLAQDAPATSDATQPPLGTPFVDATYADWEILCTQIDEAGTIACEMYQLLNDSTGSPIAEISIAALPFEVFVEIGLEIKKKSPFEKTIVIGLANTEGGFQDFKDFQSFDIVFFIH